MNLWIPVLASSLLQFLWEAAALALLVVAAQPWLQRRSAGARYGVHAAALFALPVLFGITVAHYAAFGPAVGSAAASQPLLHASAPYLVVAWMLGVVICGGYAAAGWTWAQLLRRAQRSAAAAVPAAWRAEMERLAVAMNLRVRVRLQLSSRISGPCTLGWWHPVILLPLSAVTALPPGQLRALLAHELAHIRRHDYLVNLAQRAVEAVFFFHPAVWWLSHQLSEVREQCCDDAAVAVCGDRAAYARALVDLAAWQNAGATPAAALAASGGSLSQRITRLLGRGPSPHPRAWRSAVALVLVAATGALLLGASAQTIPPPPAPPAAPAAPRPVPAPAPAPVPPPVPAPRVPLPVPLPPPHAPRPLPPLPPPPPLPPGPGQATVVAFTLDPVPACTASPVWVPEQTPSGRIVLHLEMVPRCVPVLRPVELLVFSSL